MIKLRLLPLVFVCALLSSTGTYGTPLNSPVFIPAALGCLAAAADFSVEGCYPPTQEFSSYEGDGAVLRAYNSFLQQVASRTEYPRDPNQR